MSEIHDMIDVLNTVFFDLSPKKQGLLERVIKNYGCGTRGINLNGLCKTRCVERHTSQNVRWPVQAHSHFL